jgi:hypothetical protein
MTGERMSVDISDRGKLKYWEKNLFQCHFVHHAFDMDWPAIEVSLLC